jgi:hypothetical protein
MLVSLVEKVGGEKLKWSGGGDHTNAKSRPKQHLARFYDVSMDFEEHVFILVPPKVRSQTLKKNPTTLGCALLNSSSIH